MGPGGRLWHFDNVPQDGGSAGAAAHSSDGDFLKEIDYRLIDSIFSDNRFASKIEQR